MAKAFLKLGEYSILLLLVWNMLQFTLGSSKTYKPIKSTNDRNATHIDNRPSATLVTALYYIGREKWEYFPRPFHSYLKHFEYILKLRTQLVIYCEESTKNILKEMYGNLINSDVSIIVKPFNEIEFEQYRQVIKDVLNSEEFVKDNMMLTHPEGFSLEYLLLVNNKVSFIFDAIRRNIFKSTHFFWIDAGFGHGDKSFFPNHTIWSPSKLLVLNKTVTLTQLTNPVLYKDIPNLHKVRVGPSISAEFFGGHRKAVTEFYHLYNKEFRKMLPENIIDDEQSVFLSCYFELPRLFHLVPGKWFESLKLYS